VQAPAAPPARFAPAEVRVKTGAEVSFNLMLAAPAELSGLEVVLRYDAARLDGLEGAAGSLLTLDGRSVGVERSVEPGRLRIRLTRPLATTGAGAVVSFRARAGEPGSGLAAVESLTLYGPGGELRLAPPPPVRIEVQP